MTENEPIDPQQSLTTETASEATMPLTVSEFGDDAGFDPLASDEGGRRISTGTILIIVVIGIAVGGLVTMRTFARITAAVTGNLEVESTIDDWLNNFKGEEDTDLTSPIASNDAIEVLTTSYSKRQVPLDNVYKNPFILPGETNQAGETADPLKAALEQREREIAEKTALFETIGNRLELKSVMLGADPLANIDGRIVQIGDVLEVDGGSSMVAFAVTAITAQTATLVAEEPKLDLSVEITLRLDID